MPKEPSNPPAARPVHRRRRAVEGFLLGGLLALAGAQFGVRAALPFGLLDSALLLAPLGAWVALTRARRLLWWLAGAAVGLFLLVGYTPLLSPLAAALVRGDPLEPADAVVVLAAEIDADGTPSPHAQARLFEAYMLLGEGYAPTLALTRLPPGRPSYLPHAREQLRRLGVEAELVETGPVRSTREEALAVAELARGRGWERVILVTSASHTRRAGAAFEKAGVPVLVAPATSPAGSLGALSGPRRRLSLFPECFWEFLRIPYYRLRGWT